MKAWSCGDLREGSFGVLPSRGACPADVVLLRWRRQGLRGEDAVAQHILHGPDLVGQPGGHGRGALQPLSSSQGREAQARVGPAKVVGRADQPHPAGQQGRAVGQASAAPG